MSMRLERRRTIFDHIPRTGGTSVKLALAAALGECVDVSEVTCPHHAAVTIARDRRAIGSHLWFYPGESLAPGFLYATILREPVQRFLSQYAFYRMHRAHVRDGRIAEPDVVAAVDGDLEAYLRDPLRE